MKSLLLLFLFLAPVLAEETLHVYHIGNSLTASLTLDRVHLLFEQANIDYQFGSQLSGGKSLIRHMNYKQEPGQKWIIWETIQVPGGGFEPDPNPYYGEKNLRFGLHEQALSENDWDAVVLQIYGSSLRDDVKALEYFTGIALENNRTDRFYIYSTWPTRKKTKADDGSILIKDIDYAAVWLKPYAFDVTSTDKRASWDSASRDYTDKLYAEMRKRLPDSSELMLVPAGEVLYQLDEKIKAGEIPGLQELAERDPEKVPGWKAEGGISRGINLLYADPVHLNPIPHKGATLGTFVSGTTMFTVLSGKNPVGMSASPYGLDDEKDAELIRAVQQVIWETITADPRTGVNTTANP